MISLISEVADFIVADVSKISCEDVLIPAEVSEAVCLMLSIVEIRLSRSEFILCPTSRMLLDTSATVDIRFSRCDAISSATSFR